MELLLRLITGPTHREDVSLSVDEDHTVGEAISALAAFAEVPAREMLSVSRSGTWEQFRADQPLGDIGLVSGDTVAIGSHHRERQPTTNDAVFRLAVTSGPNAGRSFDLSYGEHALGRSNDVGITLDDPMVSRHHLSIRIQPDEPAQLHVNPQAVNKVRINGDAVEGIITLGQNDVVQIGASRLRLREAIQPQPRARDYFGGVPFLRTPYFRTPIPEKLFDAMGGLPVKPAPRRFQVITALSPLIMGVAMALMLSNTRYLVMAVFSPMVAIANWWDQRNQGGIDYEKAVERFDGDLEARVGEIAAARQIERVHRVQNSPDLELLARRADSKHNELWQRDREADDFLSVRVGVGAGKAQIVIKPEGRGDKEFVERLERATEHATTLPDVPISIDLAELGVVALVGEQDEASELLSALILQACCLHSPEDIVVLGALDHGRRLGEWMKWLPHTRASSSPVGGAQLVSDSDSANDLLRRVAKVAEARATSKDTSVDRRWPWIVLAIDQELAPDASVVSRLLDLCPSAGISVIWLTESHTRVPRQAKAVVDLQSLRSAELSHLRFVDVEQEPIDLDPERLSSDVALAVAQSLAPLRDATAANAITAIPRMVPLFASLGVSSMSPEWIAEQWSTDRGYSLVAPIGMTDSGPLTLDLVSHGPHGLIGGTSGAGKSELVQSLVVNLAAFNSPERINFLFVDYKGGALSEMFKDIPHTVGAVTNLDQLLALRALTSLTAELDRRMELFKGRAPDIKDMIAKFSDEAPPSLVIVVDEFAALVRELPEFVDGIVSIAERGRSLGIHLLMSTQRPSGAINDNIQQNTNLRIALRMLDSGESNNVIGAPDAAMIPGPLKGRGLARLGPGELLPFQSAWSGAPLLAEEGSPPASVKSFVVRAVDERRPVGAAPKTTEGPVRTQLDATVESIIDAAAQLGLQRGRAPWKETLPTHIPLGQLLEDERSCASDEVGTRVTIGMIDDPAAQDQYPGQLDFAEKGSAVIFGNSGSGKSTLLKTIAASAAARDSQNGGGGLTIFALDFASRELGLLSRLPQTSAVVTGDNLEGVTRVLSLLDAQMDARRDAMAQATAVGDLAPEYVSVLLVIDGYENFVQMCESTGREMLVFLDMANRLIADGRTYGINVAFTASRRGAVRSNVMASISNRFILRQVDDSGYAELGIPMKLAKGLELEPGQGFNEEGQSVRFAIVGDQLDDGTTDDRSAMIQFGEGLIGAVAPELVTADLPVEVPAIDRDVSDIAPNHVRLGIADRTLLPVDADLSFNNIVVVGAPRSGKSTALVTIARQLVAGGTEVWVAGPQGSRLASVSGVANSAFGRVADLMPFFEEMATTIETFPGVERALIYDDVDLADDRKMYESAQAILDSGARFIGSTSTMRGLGTNPFFSELKTARIQLVLQPEDSREVSDLTGVNGQIRPGMSMVPGRGVLIADRMPTVLQTSTDEVADFATPCLPAGMMLTPMPERRPLSRSRPAAATTTGATCPPVPQQPAATNAAAANVMAADSASTSPPDQLAMDLARRDQAQPDQSRSRQPSALDIVLESGQRVPIEGPLIIGRRPGDTGQARALTLTDPCMSARHLLIDLVEGSPHVVDQQSRNGTVIRNATGARRLEPGALCPLQTGDEIYVGEMVLRVAQADIAQQS